MDICEYLKKNIYLLSLIGFIIILLVATFILLRKNKEQFNNVHVEMEANNDKFTIPSYLYTSKVANKNDVLTKDIINFSCIVDGKKYYLANALLSDCKNKVDYVPDCDISTIVLISEEEINANLKKYREQLIENDLTCMKNNKIVNKNFCRQKRQFVHDFKLFYASKIINENKYIVRGTAKPLLNGYNEPTLINQYIGQIYDSELLCSGDYGYDIKKDENLYGEIYIIKPPNSDLMEKCLLKMKSYTVLKGTPGKPAVRITENGKDKTIDTYFCIDKKNKCNNYNRLKLSSNENDKDIIYFNIEIVK